MSAKIKPSPEVVAELSGPLPARLILEVDGQERGYAMCQALNLNVGGVFLASGFLLELDEAVTLELTLADGSVKVRGRVVQLMRDDDDPGMMVTFVDTGDGERAFIEAQIAAADDMS